MVRKYALTYRGPDCMNRRLLLYLISAMALTGTAIAQMRQIPADAQRGWLRHVQETVIAIDDKQIMIAPGGTIRNAQNMIVVPASLPAEGALAEYLLNPSGQVTRAWLLTPEEAAREKKPKR